MWRSIGPRLIAVWTIYDSTQVSSAGQPSKTIAISGLITCAVTVAPRTPTSSCAAQAPTISTFSSWPARVCMVLRIAAHPRRQSKLLPTIRSVVSEYVNVTSGTTGSPIRMPNFSTASSLETAPTSTVISFISRGALRSCSVMKCGGLLAVSPGIYSPNRLRTRTLWAGILWFTQPPIWMIRRVPFGQIACTIKPTSSLCASSWTTGRLPLFSLRRIYRLRMRSSVISPSPSA